MIKCPCCGKSHFKVNSEISTLNPNKITYLCTCLECHIDFYAGDLKTIADIVVHTSLSGDTTAHILKTEPIIGTPCLVCGEAVKIKDPNDTPKICDKCKEAILRVRRWKEGIDISCDSAEVKIGQVDQINSVKDLRMEDIVEFYNDAEFRYVLTDEWGITDEEKQEFVTDEDSSYYSFNEVTKVWRQNKCGDYVLIFAREQNYE